MKAIDSKGNDILELVKEKDKLSWVSNPFGRNLEREEQVRDGMLLEFSRPQDRGFARLVFSVRNTAWASYMEGHLSRLHGKNLAQWREWMNSSAAAREGFRKALEREVMFSLKLWTGQSWKDVDHIWSVGPACPKDVAVELDIRDIPGPTLRLKLESTAGLWTVDCAKADFTPAQPIAVTEAHPIQAKDNKDGDISGLLKNIDGLDYVLTSDEDWAELSFRAPAPKKGYDRSLILKSTGYYLVPGSPEAEPEKAAAGMMMKPGAFGKYSLELLSGYMKAALARMERNQTSDWEFYDGLHVTFKPAKMTAYEMQRQFLDFYQKEFSMKALFNPRLLFDLEAFRNRFLLSMLTKMFEKDMVDYLSFLASSS